MENAAMDYLEFRIWKGVAICVGVFLYAIWLGYNRQ